MPDRTKNIGNETKGHVSRGAQQDNHMALIFHLIKLGNYTKR